MTQTHHLFRHAGPVTTAEVAIKYTTAAVGLAILFLYLIRGFISSRLPLWLRPFAQEEPPDEAKRRPWSRSTLSLLIIAFIGLALTIAPIILGFRRADDVIDILPWLSALLLTAVDRPVKTPKMLLVLYLAFLAANVAIYFQRFLNYASHFDMDPFRIARLGLCFLALVIIGSMPLRDPSWGSKEIGQSAAPSCELRSPEDDLCLFSFWSVQWVYPLARLCRSQEITEEDVWQLPFDFQHSRLYMAFRELEGRLLPCLIKANGLDLVIATTLAVAERVAEVTNIRLAGRLYAALDSHNPKEAYCWCLTILSLDTARQVCKTSSSWYARKAYERSRGETFIALFGKLLTRAVPGSDTTERGPQDKQHDGALSSGQKQTGFKSIIPGLCSRKRGSKPSISQQSASNAKVVNLVRGDTYEISQRFWDFPKLIAQPIKVLVTMYYLIDIMGWPSAVGVGLMILFLTVNSLLVKKLISLERSRTAHSDKRAQAVSHFVEASRPLKLNGWTALWSERIMKFRDLEMAKRLQICYVSAGIATVSVAGGAAYPLASICLYTVILGQGLPNDVIWPSLQLFAQLEASVKEAFDLVSAYCKAAIPVGRVNRYMDEPDRDVDCASGRAASDIVFREASFSWPTTNAIVLTGVDLRFTTGLTVVRGKVGSGKSSLLLAALNEMELQQGTLTRPDCAIAYAQQLPWLQNKTIRDNIVFHHRYDPLRYRQTLHVCALGVDLAALPGADLTKLEEGGVGLSGGQKARVALARAIYSPSSILLLDDPLAALDHDTAALVVQRFLQGPLAKGRTIVMVTHRDDLVLRIADQVVDMEDGCARVLTREEVEEELARPYHRVLEPDSQGKVGESAAAAGDDGADEVSGLKEGPEEAGETGSVSLSVYTKYMKAGGWLLWVLLGLAYGASRACDILRARLLEAWGAETTAAASLSSADAASRATMWGLPRAEEKPAVWILLLGALSVGQIVTYGIAQGLLARISINAARKLFKTAVDKVGRATMRYHDKTSTGQLKNRLISDMGMVDGGIVAPLESFVYNAMALVLSVAAIASHKPVLLAVLGGVSLLIVYLFRTYVPVSRSLRRLEMRYLTPIIANIGVMQDGLVTIRAQRSEVHFQERHLGAVDDFQRQDHFFWSMALWLDMRLSIASAATRAALVLLMMRLGTPASAIGFVLTQTALATAAVQQLCERFAQLQLDAVSLERVDSLSRIPEEDAGGDEPPPGWPGPGDAVRFEGLVFRYAENLPPVLNGVTLEIPGGSTCAVLGRTGSGKSTLANALLATQKLAGGSISIGSVDLASLNRVALRNRVTFIQQDPVLFPGTMRDNIDPARSFDDGECLAAIQRVLGEGFGLESGVDAGGKNLSQGQRQLVGIARAVLNRSGLVILDEATASIDRGTAATVQRVLREELASSTVITIAHRLEAVEDADWCVVLDGGRVVECGPAGGRFEGRSTE